LFNQKQLSESKKVLQLKGRLHRQKTAKPLAKPSVKPSVTGSLPILALTWKWATAIFVQSKIFRSLMRWNETKFGLGRKVQFKKSFKLYRQILVRATTKVAENFIHFALRG